MPGLGASYGRGGATTFAADLAHADAVLIMGSNTAECHAVAFRWVMAAKNDGARIIHADPRFTRTSAMADIYAPLRAGTDIVFLGALIRYVIENEAYFKDCVVHYTNAATLISTEFRDTDDLAGVFSGFDPEARRYDTSSWQYQTDDSGQPLVDASRLSIRPVCR